MKKGRIILAGLLVAAAALVGWTSVGAASGHETEAAAHATGDRSQTHDLIWQVRRATRAYRNVEVAEAAGYAPISPCVEDPKYGGMGIHYENRALVEDGVLDPLRPEVLVYQPTWSGTLRLGAVEYLEVDADQNLATDGDRPWMFGLPFDGPMLGHSPGMPIHYDLHAWLFRANPAGTFAMWNPRVHCPA
jgi:hypothetical protein